MKKEKRTNAKKVRNLLIGAVLQKALSDVASYRATVELMLDKGVAIGEHTNGHFITDLTVAMMNLQDAQDFESYVRDYYLDGL